MSVKLTSPAGFTLIELLVAMAVFSLMLVIVSAGFINVVHIRNQALASNKTQDSARTAMNELVRAVRDSAGVVGTPGPGPNGTLCLSERGAQLREYYVDPVDHILKRWDGCGGAPVSPQAITNDSVKVVSFTAVQDSTGAAIVKPEVQLNITVSTGLGSATSCNDPSVDRNFCSITALTSGAVPR